MYQHNKHSKLIKKNRVFPNFNIIIGTQTFRNKKKNVVFHGRTKNKTCYALTPFLPYKVLANIKHV